MSRKFFRLVVLGLLTTSALRDLPLLRAAEKQPEEQLVCPVFTDQIVGPKSRSFRHRGIVVYFSSDLAARKWMRDPVSYLDKDLLPQLADLNLPAHPIPQSYCPVYPKRKVSLKDPSVIYQGKRVFLFDKSALRIWNSAPKKFADPKILPQLETEEKAPEGEAENPNPA